MPEWLKILFAILTALGIIGALIYVGIILYKKSNKPGTCSFIPYSPLSPGEPVGRRPRAFGSRPNESPPPNTKIQCGYFSCTSPLSLTVKNNGPGMFYLGPLSGQTGLYELDENASVTFPVQTTTVNVYYDSSSKYNTPTFSLSYS